MGFPKCDVFTSKKWVELRDKVGGKGSLSKHSISKALDAFFKAIEKAEKTEDVPAAKLAVEQLVEVATAYANDVKKLGKYDKVEEKVRINIIGSANIYKAKLPDDKDYSDEAGKALKIGEGWISTIGKCYQQLEEQKKGPLAKVKLTLERVESALAKGHHVGNERLVQELEFDLLDAKKQLTSVRQKSTEIYSSFNLWAINEPRRNMGYIGSTLKLGDPQSGPYTFVAKAIKDQLTKVAEAINGVEQIWLRDMTFQLDSQDERVALLIKQMDNAVDAVDALNERIGDQIERFNQQCNQIYTDLKVAADTDWLVKAREGAVDPAKATTHVAIYRKKAVMIPKLIEGIEKNHQRILKLVPKDQLDTFEKSKEGKGLAQSSSATVARLRQATKLYDLLLDEYKKQGFEA